MPSDTQCQEGWSSPERVAALYLEGVVAVEESTAAFTSEEWRRVACGEWDAAQTARHLVVVAGWYHEWLDRAVAGDSQLPFPAADLEARNRSAVGALADLDGPAAIVRFAQLARTYQLRARDSWELAYGYPFGTVTVGLHLGVAATEWHLHAWDLTTAVGASYEPTDPVALFRAASRCLAATKGPVTATALRVLAPVGARLRPWTMLLARSGRRS